MAVQYVQGGGGLLGALGSLATLGGAFIPGAQWLTPLGLGMTTVDDIIRGNPLGAGARTAAQILDGTLGGWLNPASGTIGNSKGVVTKPDAQITDEWRKSMILQNQNPYMRGNAWQQ